MICEPATVTLAPPEVRQWGPYQFPGLERLSDGRLQVSFQVGADSVAAVGLPPMQAISADEGRTWTVLPLGDDSVLVAYSNYNLPNAEGKICKGIQVRKLKVVLD